MKLWDRIKIRFASAALPAFAAAAAYLDWKTLFEKMRVGLNGLEPFPRFDKHKLFAWGRESDIAFACVQKIVEACQDPDLIVERRGSKDKPWETEPGHPLRRLMMRPNPEMTQSEFLGAWLASEEICGEFFAEIERDGRDRPARLWPLDPTCIHPAYLLYPRKYTEGWIWRGNGYAEEVYLSPRDVFYSLRRDPQCPWMPLAPLRVALGTVEADAMQSGFVRAFFKNSGVPSGIIKIKGRRLGDEEAEGMRQRWMRRYGAGGRFQAGPAVFDENADYEKIGSDLSEIEGGALRAQNEARICGVFGVPPILVSAYVGLLYVNQRASAKEAHLDFWMNKMSPTFKRMRSRLTWTLLLEFESEEVVRAERIRLNWDMSQVIALQESMSEKSMRAREDLRAGALTLNEFRAVLGMAPLPDGDYYLRRVNQLPITDEVVRRQMVAAIEATAQATALALSGVRDPAQALADAEMEEDFPGEKRRRKRGRKIERKANDDDDFLLEELEGDPDEVEEEKTYLLWTLKLNSETPCWFCAEMDGQQEVTELGEKPNGFAGPNPFCVTADFGPNRCKCTIESTEISAEEAKAIGGLGARGRFSSRRKLSPEEIEKLKQEYAEAVARQQGEGENRAQLRQANYHWHKGPDGKWYAWTKKPDGVWHRLDDPPPGSQFIPPQDERPGPDWRPDPSWPVNNAPPPPPDVKPGPTVWNQDPGGRIGKYTYVEQINGWVKTSSLEEWELRPDGTWALRKP